jgi:hypothetical protein
MTGERVRAIRDREWVTGEGGRVVGESERSLAKVNA